MTLLLLGAGGSHAQRASSTEINDWVRQASIYQLDELHHTTWSLRYRVHRVDSKEDTVRDLVESTEGNVARTLVRNGQLLTPEQDAAEQQRLRALPAGEIGKHSHGGSMDTYTDDLIRVMPHAMLFALAPAQTQMPQLAERQVLLDFKPNPDFHPASTAESLLTGVAGQIWLDAGTHHVLRMEIHIIKNLNLALGLIARVYQGGTVVYEQRPVGGGHSAYSHIAIDVTLRELMVRTVPYHSVLDASDVILPYRPSAQEAITMLLDRAPAGMTPHE